MLEMDRPLQDDFLSTTRRSFQVPCGTCGSRNQGPGVFPQGNRPVSTGGDPVPLFSKVQDFGLKKGAERIGTWVKCRVPQV